MGVTIYEMITGGPPHSDLVNLRAIALIPKAKPPRLPEGIGSKDMRDFVASCLREVPGEASVAFGRRLSSGPRADHQGFIAAIS